MRSWLQHGDVCVENPDLAHVATQVRTGEPFWLDIQQPTDKTIDGLAAVLDLHPLAVKDSKQFGQSGKMVVYGDLVMLVGFGIDLDSGEPIEVHGYLSEDFLVTFHREAAATLDRLRDQGSLRDLLGGEPARILHHVATELHDDFPPYIDQLEDRLAVVEAEMLDQPLAEHLGEIAEIRRRADYLRRTLNPGRDLSVRSMATLALPGDTSDAPLYARDIADELQLITADLAAIGERCVTAIGLHTSLASNRQSAASRQLAAVATVFLPITFVVGFFGMNFDVLTDDVEQGWPAFLLLGVLLNVVCVVATAWWLGRRGWR